MEGCQKVVLRPLSVEDFDLKIGFIGAGRMAQALSQGFVHSGLHSCMFLLSVNSLS